VPRKDCPAFTCTSLGHRGRKEKNYLHSFAPQPPVAVLSLLLREPHISAEQAFNDFIHFYRTVASYNDDLVVAKFEEVTMDFGEVIRWICTHLCTKFKHFEHTEENLQKVFHMVEQMDKQDTGLSDVKEKTVARPSAYREKLKKRAEAKLETPKAKRLLLES